VADTDRHKEERRVRRDNAMHKLIKTQAERGHTCCLDKPDVPDNFRRCIDCSKPLDKGGEIC